MLKDRIVAYPYDIELASIVRHSNLIQNTEIAGIVSPNGWGFCNSDASRADGGIPLGITVESSFENISLPYDTVLFSCSDNNLHLENTCLMKIEEAIKTKRNIICTRYLDDDFLYYIKRSCENNNNYFRYFSPQKGNFKNVLDMNEPEYLYPINVPIILILGLAEKTQKFEIQLALREQLIKRKYKISQIGSRSYCELFDFHSFPDFMYMAPVSESQKVILFNHYIKSLEVSENPDILIIGVPGGILPINDYFPNRFGIMAYEVSQSIQPDITIMSTLYEDYKKEYFESMNTLIKYKFGFEIDYYNLSNTQFDWINAKEYRKYIYNTIDYKHIEKKKSKYGDLCTPVYNLLNGSDINIMADDIISRLQGFANVQSI